MPAYESGEQARFRIHRLLAVLAVAVLAAGSGPAATRLATAAGYLAVEAVGILCQVTSERSARARRLWVAAALLDVAASAFVAFRLGPTGSPVLLLLALPVLIWGLTRGIAGGSWAAAGGIAAHLALCGLIPRLGADLTARIAPASVVAQATSLVLLGLLAGLLGRRLGRAEAMQHSTARELEQARLDAETIVAHLSHGLLCVDDSGRISRLNAGARELLGGFGEIRPGVRLAELLLFESLFDLAMHLASRLASTREEICEVTLGSSPGRAAVLVEVTTTPILDQEGRPRGLVVLLADLTERRAREEERRRHDRLALLGQLSAGLAHEIRNSLKPISGSVELLRRELPEGGGARDTLMEIILRESEALEAFLGEFLHLARDKSLQMEELPLERVVGEELDSLASLPGGSFQLARPDPAEPLLRVRADRSCLRQILRNLGLNAIEAGGLPVEVGWRRVDEEAEIYLRDHGSGLAEEIRARVFEPFFTTKPRGTGLGLAIARDLAERLGGRLALEPAEGGGTRASLRLPLISARAERTGPRIPAARAA
jgi:two-component system, NtrC family, sensor histidine kinase PilS